MEKMIKYQQDTEKEEKNNFVSLHNHCPFSEMCGYYTCSHINYKQNICYNCNV